MFQEFAQKKALPLVKSSNAKYMRGISANYLIIRIFVGGVNVASNDSSALA